MTAIRCSRGRAVAGFSLVEMMVAMTIGVLILLAVSEVFINNNRTRTEIEKTSRQIENGRYAMQLLEGELANAGFFGEASAQPFPASFWRCPKTETRLRDAMGVPVYGQNNIASGSQPSCLSNYKFGNDYLAIRRSSTCAVGSAGCDAFKTSHFHIQVSACSTSNPGQVLVKNSASALTAMNRKCINSSSELAPRYRFLSRLYYVNSSDVLVVAELGNPNDTPSYVVTPLVDGIERLHLQYGLDNNGDGEVDAFDATPTGSEWEDVVAVRIWLLARNLDPTPGYTDDRSYTMGNEAAYTPADAFKRQLYTSTVRLNNVAGRREAPSADLVAGGESGDGDTTDPVEPEGE